MASKKKHLPIQVGSVIYNEKDRLPVWLKYWQPIAERVLIIDQGSDDGTQQMLKDSGVTWRERLPHGNADIHWNDLISMTQSDKPFFRLGVDEFITRANLKRIARVIKAHPQIVMWWMRRINWVNGIDACEHPEVKKMLNDDLQAVISFGRPYTFTGQMHGWPVIRVPGDKVGYIERDLAWVDHRRTLDGIIEANVSREHMCRTQSSNDQTWFLRVCKELVDGNYTKVDE